ncbi:MAG: hypothetical protein Q9M27_05065 [Mariprofundaceae bacterium]|nr:hypothetical protein [Mariprofundaceae bacterium]
MKRIIFSSLLIMAMMAVLPAGAQAEELKRAKTENVCMVNDQDMRKPQIPIQVKGKTYYGCCAMCVSGLTNDPEQRRAIDPVSGHAVDKADAIIGARVDGSVLYFENTATFMAYQQKGGTP